MSYLWASSESALIDYCFQRTNSQLQVIRDTSLFLTEGRKDFGLSMTKDVVQE